MIRHFLPVFVLFLSPAPGPGHAADSPPQKEIEAFVRAATSSKPEAAYAMLTESTKATLGEPQFNAYMHVRRDLLGALISVAPANRAPEEDGEGVQAYSIDLKFAHGRASAVIAFASVDGKRRVAQFSIPLPKGSQPKIDDTDYLIIMTDFVDVIGKHGLTALGSRLSKQALAESNLSRDEARALFADFDELLGRMTHYKIDTPLTHDSSCRTLPVHADFERGQAVITLDLCANDGLWQLVATDVTPVVTPWIAEHQLQKALAQKMGRDVRVVCPHDAPFPVGSDISCRVDGAEGIYDATVRRTAETHVQIVAVQKR